VTYGFLEIASTPSVKAAQATNGSVEHWSDFQGDRSFDRFTQSEADFIAQRDSLYMATVSSTGWPYIQDRGGPIGFLRVLDEKTFGVADLRGNRQYISVGNIGADDRTAEQRDSPWVEACETRPEGVAFRKNSAPGQAGLKGL
jgi:predicted pyridoxine 5'-phosphate oxidase superfamily flavin-nucleotide-binding protein